MVFVFNERYRLNKMANLAKFKDNILDIGCVQLPNKYIKNKNVTGLDIIQGQLPSNYSNFILGTLKTIVNDPTIKFDGIIAGELIEHLNTPLDFLKDCYELLSNDGILVISTPNPHSLIETILTLTLNQKYYYTKEHICLFPQRWLIRMLNITGFRDVKILSGGFPIPYLGLVPCPRFFCHQTIALAKK